MSTCKDCIHYGVCKYLDGTITYTVASVTGDVVKKIEAITCGKFVTRTSRTGVEGGESDGKKY